MTKKQRKQVVELLRCAADLYHRDLGGLGHSAVLLLGDSALGDEPRDPLWVAACNAWSDASIGHMIGWNYADVCLEAAQRVEDGEWP